MGAKEILEKLRASERQGVIFNLCGEWCTVLEITKAIIEIEQLQAENKEIRETLKHINTCLIVLDESAKSEDGVKDLHRSIKKLAEYVEQRLKDEGGE